MKLKLVRRGWCFTAKLLYFSAVRNGPSDLQHLAASQSRCCCCLGFCFYLSVCSAARGDGDLRLRFRRVFYSSGVWFFEYCLNIHSTHTHNQWHAHSVALSTEINSFRFFRVRPLRFVVLFRLVLSAVCAFVSASLSAPPPPPPPRTTLRAHSPALFLHRLSLACLFWFRSDAGRKRGGHRRNYQLSCFF